MHPELTNLLPLDRTRGLTHEYFFRLATVAVLILAAVVLGSGMLLAPSYLYVVQENHVREMTLASLNTQLASSQGTEAAARLSELSNSATYLARLASTTAATAALRGVLSAPRPGITLNGFNFTPAIHGADGKMTITGTASTREALRAYNDALSQLPFVSSVDLPISAYAQETAIPFTITLTGTLAP